ncbi:MAG TPA: segregation/condensation protein A [Candidatus Omnitrophota bacterium]|nr:segregation/condensation protein A [Candidatus Omnitrophota bacterium]HPS19873.1 segregation/condensation protein A [Candidatus Omnitrophota bacterium]
MTYKVKLNFFEGPLDLLLFLIKKERIDIYDIPISRITEQYLEYLELMKLLDLSIAGDFLVMAATLMHIKSKMLLPPDENATEEELEDPREELVRRLLEYKKYKEAAMELNEMRDKNKELFYRTGTGEREALFVDENGEYFEASLFDLINAFRKVLGRIPKETFHEVVRDKFTVSDKIKYICSLLPAKSKLLFSELFVNMRSKDEVIATFLAVLELMKMREILVVQRAYFSEIEIVRHPEPANVYRDQNGVPPATGAEGENK